MFQLLKVWNTKIQTIEDFCLGPENVQSKTNLVRISKISNCTSSIRRRQSWLYFHKGSWTTLKLKMLSCIAIELKSCWFPLILFICIAMYFIIWWRKGKLPCPDALRRLGVMSLQKITIADRNILGICMPFKLTSCVSKTVYWLHEMVINFKEV